MVCYYRIMSIFSKIKNNINHGGVKIDIQAPASVSMQDQSLPVQITLTNGEQLQTIKRVYAEIQATSRNTSFNNDTASQTAPTMHVTAHAENVEQFVLQPGETKVIDIAIIMNAAAAVQAQLPQDGFAGQAVGMLKKLQSVDQALNGDSYTYDLHAAADVDGIALDPSASQPLQVLKPGQIGTAINFHI